MSHEEITRFVDALDKMQYEDFIVIQAEYRSRPDRRRPFIVIALARLSKMLKG